MSCKRNAFLMLLHADQERALAYLADRLDHVHGFGDILQLVIVELIYKVRISGSKDYDFSMATKVFEDQGATPTRSYLLTT